MNQALKSIAVPKLRLLGFKGSFPHFRRVYDGHVDLLVFQFNKYGGSFVTEIGQLALHELAEKYWNPKLSLSNATVYDTSNRQRLGAIGHGDHWFVFGKENDQFGREEIEADEVYESIASSVAVLIESEAVECWNGRSHLINKKVLS